MHKGFMALVAIPRTCGLKMQLGTPLSGGKHPRVNILVCKELFWSLGGEGRHKKTPCMGFWRVLPGVYASWKPVTKRRFLTCMRPAVLHQKEHFPDFMQFRLLAILCTCWKIRGADFQQT